jgi:uncharacterized membrane protein
MSDASFKGVDAVRYGWKTTQQNLRPLLIIGAGVALLSLFDAALGSARGPLPGLTRLILQALQVAFALVGRKAALKLHDGGKLEAPLLAGQLGGYFTFLLTWVLYALIVSVGLLLFIVPGVIWGLEFAFAGYLVVDQKLDPIQALRASRQLTDGVKGPLLGFALLLLGLNLLGVLAFGIGLLVTVPASYLAGAWVYRRLQQRAEQRHIIFRPTPVAT